MRGSDVTQSNPRHGSYLGYFTDSCRCDECRAAASAYSRGRRNQRKNSPTTPHGTLNGYDNYGCRCEPCKDASSVASRKWRQENAEQKKATDAAYRAAHRDENVQYLRRYYAENRDRLRIQQRAYYLDNKGKNAATGRAWIARNRERHQRYQALYQRARQVRRSELDTREVSLRDWRRLCLRFDDRCAYCGSRSKLTQDHIIPIIRGGRHSIGNLLPACGSCNSSKGAKLLVEWRALSLI